MSVFKMVRYGSGVQFRYFIHKRNILHKMFRNYSKRICFSRKIRITNSVVNLNVRRDNAPILKSERLVSSTELTV